MLNLFLVLLLSSFSSDALTDSNTDEHDIDKITEAKGRVLRLVSFVRKTVIRKICSWRESRREQPPSYVEGMTMSYIEGMLYYLRLRSVLLWYTAAFTSYENRQFS